MLFALEGKSLEVALTTTNAAAQAWYGYEQGIIAGILISDDFHRSFPELARPSVEGIFTSSFSLGNLLGCALAALFGDRLGRRRTLWVGSFISATGGILQAAAYGFPMLMVGRIVSGIGNGMTSATCGVYQAEASRSHRRGKLSVIVVLHNVVFYMIGSWLTLGTSYLNDSGQWRMPFALQLVPAIVLCSFLFLLPESPRWLLLRGKHTEALEALRRYLGSGLTIDDEIVQTEYKSIRGAIELERQSEITFKQVMLCRDRSGHLKRLLLGCGGQFMQQLRLFVLTRSTPTPCSDYPGTAHLISSPSSGINALNYYFSIILKENLGMSELVARILTGANATSYCISTGLAFWMIDRFGRRTLMISGLSLQCFAYVMVSMAIGLLATAPQQWGAVAISFLFFYYAAFGCTWGMVPWIYQAEINSLQMRTRGAAAATATNWIFGFVCTQFTSVGIRNLGYRFYIIFAAMNLIFLPVVYFLYPETANRTLEDMNDYFDRDSPHRTIIRFGDKTAKQHQRPVEAIEAERRRVEVTTELEVATNKNAASVEHVEVPGSPGSR